MREVSNAVRLVLIFLGSKAVRSERQKRLAGISINIQQRIHRTEILG